MPPKAAQPPPPVPEVPPEPPAPQTGEGSFVFEDRRAKYTGQWQLFDGVLRKHGKGIYEEGSQRYEGDFVEDRMEGKGVFKFESGAVYAGGFHNNMFNGKGSYSWPDGSKYEGEWRDNKMHGHGTFTTARGQQFHGEFANGVGPGLHLHVH